MLFRKQLLFQPRLLLYILAAIFTQCVPDCVFWKLCILKRWNNSLTFPQAVNVSWGYYLSPVGNNIDMSIYTQTLDESFYSAISKLHKRPLRRWNLFQYGLYNITVGLSMAYKTNGSFSRSHFSKRQNGMRSFPLETVPGNVTRPRCPTPEMRKNMRYISARL